MGYILFIIQVIISLIFPIWLYLWFSEHIKKNFLPIFGLKCTIPDMHFLIKQWWAKLCIANKKKGNKRKFTNHDTTSLFTLDDVNPCLENPKNIKDENSCDSVSFYGADQKGNSLFIKLARRRFRTAELSLQLITSDGQIYVLPDSSDRVIIGNVNQGWFTSDLKIELLEVQQRWRIIYNGMLRNESQKHSSIDDTVEHIRLNFIFIANSRAFEWPGDWSTNLHSHALAREPWRSPQWINKIQKLEYNGYDQWGSMIGQIRFQDSSSKSLYLRGLNQRRWGKHESHEFQKAVIIFGVMSNGAMFYLGASNTRHSFQLMHNGCIKKANEQVSPIDWTNLDIDHFTDADVINIQDGIHFIAAGMEYNITVTSIKPHATVLYSGQPWNWKNYIRTVEIELNGNIGTGLIQVWCPYNGPCSEKTTKTHLLKSPNVSVRNDEYTLFFTDEKCQNENIVGGKGVSLAILSSTKDMDFIVPQGFCITVFALALHIEMHKNLQDILNLVEDISTGKKDGDLQKCCEEASKLFESTPIVEPVRQAILKAIEKLKLSETTNVNSNEGDRYAIRSSAVGEDSEETSAAGQNATFLGIKDTNDIIAKVAKCWASLYSHQSVEYRRQHSLPIKASMGICIQKMVNADAAGVMFTRHPTSGDPSSIYISANYGLGETVVSGMIEPDTLIIHKSLNNQLTLKETLSGSKLQKISLTDNGITTSALDKQQCEKVCINEAIALRLAAIGLSLESLYGNPRDVEWAVINEKIYLLQARPMTTLNVWTDFELTHELDSGVPSDLDILTFANVGEVFPNPVSPLSISTLIKILNKSIAIQHGENDCSYLCITAMRCTMSYFNTLFRYVEENLTMVNKVVDIAVCGNIVVTPKMHKVALEKYGKATLFQRLYVQYKAFKDIWKNQSQELKAKEIYNNYVLNADDFDTASSLYNEICRKFGAALDIILCHNHTSRVSIAYQTFAMIFLTKGYENFTSDHFADIAILLSSCNNVISTEVPLRLEQIAKYIKESGKAEEFCSLDSTKCIEWLRKNCAEAARQFENLLEDHGHRCIQELDVISEPWSVNPETLITTLQMTTKAFEEKAGSKVRSVEDTVASLKTPKSSFTKWVLKKIVPLCRKAVTSREMTKALTVKLVHKLRLAYHRLGKLMVFENYLPNKNLIYFLTHQEIGIILTTRNSAIVQKALRRKKLYPQLGRIQYPEINRGMPMPAENTFDTINREGCTKIQGTSVCGGSVLGRACVITNLSESKNIKPGDILITHSTDIGWSPYFPLLSGIATELGGLISHGAVVAREYGLPCIVGAKGATKNFQTGDTVLLIAEIGMLQMIQKI